MVIWYMPVVTVELLINGHPQDPLGPHSSVHLGEVSAYGRLKIQHLYVAGTMTDCPLKRGVCSWEVKNSAFVCGWDDDRLST